ncbi:MAG: phytanoyl-CoA dioxygenase family protein [Alphaproteobacteria bacterium]
MPKMLSPAAVSQFHDHGYLSPVAALSPDEVARNRLSLASFEAREGGKLAGAARNKSHLFLRWLYDLARHPKILDAVEDLIGPDILLYHAQWFIKEPHTPHFVSLHQDSAYWSLASPQGLSAWIAFEDCDAENGCMRVIPDTHRDALAHVDRQAPDNLLWRGQTVAAEIDEARAVEMPLRAGEMSLHHARIVHGSGPNRSPRRRIGYSLRYIPTSIARNGPRDSAMLVRGVDRYHHFDLEPAPGADYEPTAVALHAEINRRFMEHYTAATPERAAQ